MTRWPPRTSLIFASSCSRRTAPSAKSNARSRRSRPRASILLEGAASSTRESAAPPRKAGAPAIAELRRLQRGGRLGAKRSGSSRLLRELLVEQREQRVLGGRTPGCRHGARLLRRRDCFWLLIVSLHWSSVPRFRVLGGPVDDDLPPVRAVNRLDLLAQLALQPLGPRALPAQLVLEPEDVLDS